MPLDANKSDLTHKITSSTVTWMQNIGCKPVELECHIARSWIGDVVGMWSPTPTEAQKVKLIARKPRPREVRHRRDGSEEFLKQWHAAIDEWRPKLDEWNASYRALPSTIVVCAEVKVTRADFRKDIKGKFRRSGTVDMAVLCVPEGLVRDNEVPAGWWLLEFNKESGDLRKVKHRAGIRAGVTIEQRFKFVEALAQSMYNRVHYKHLRDYERDAREQQNERVNRTRFVNAIDVVMDVVTGKRTVEEALLWHANGRDRNISDLYLGRLKALHGVGADPIAECNVKKGNRND